MMRRVVAVALGAMIAVAVSVGPGAAQTQMDRLKNSTPEERASMQTETMKTKLALTPDQTPKIAAINLKYAQQMDPIIKSSEGPMVKMRQMRPISEAKDSELKGVLSSDQFQKYLAEREQMREQFEKRLPNK